MRRRHTPYIILPPRPLRLLSHAEPASYLMLIAPFRDASAHRYDAIDFDDDASFSIATRFILSIANAWPLIESSRVISSYALPHRHPWPRRCSHTLRP